MSIFKRQPPGWLAPTQCAGKHRFEDGGLAKKVASRASSRKDARVSAYRCQSCGGWHVGNSNHRQGAGRKPRPPEHFDE